MAGGVSHAIPTFFILEGVLQYLTEPAVKSIFDFLAKAAKDSRLAFTYGRSLYGQEGLHKRYVQKGIWIVGLEYPDGVVNLLSAYGWRLIEVQEGKAMTVTGHKTNSMYRRYGIEELDSQRDALDAVTV